ncbi:DUF4192 family protein [Timonella sp. A28]|uniref:DUF4192 family protein n=1 Tax=Timonella sp. A28 TaxID=3442640 RepID=UPI003EBD0774
MTPVLKVKHAREILSLIPYQLGFQPSNSVVVVSLRGQTRQVGMIARVDIEDAYSPHSTVSDTLIDRCVKDGATAIFVACYLDESTQNEAVKKLQHTFNAVDKAVQGKLDIIERWVISPNAYTHWPHCSEQHPEPCPLHWEPRDLLHTTHISAHMVYDGRQVLPSREALAVIEKSEEQRRAVHAQTYQRHVQVRARSAVSHRIMAWRLARIAEWDDLLAAYGEKQLPDRCESKASRAVHEEESSRYRATSLSTGKLAAALEDHVVRDAMIISVTSLGMSAARTFIAHFFMFKPSESYQEVSETSADKRSVYDEIAEDAIAKIIDVRRAEKPDAVVLNAAVELLKTVISDAESHGQVAPHALIALLEWWRGNAVVARAYADAALTVDASYGLAVKVAAVINSGLPSGWQRQQLRVGLP